MPARLHKKYLFTFSGILVLGAAYLLFFSQTPVDYNTQVKPILNQKCITCHGGVKKKGGFSLLFREEALSPLNLVNQLLFLVMPPTVI